MQTPSHESEPQLTIATSQVYSRDRTVAGAPPTPLCSRSAQSGLSRRNQAPDSSTCDPILLSHGACTPSRSRMRLSHQWSQPNNYHHTCSSSSQSCHPACLAHPPQAKSPTGFHSHTPALDCTPKFPSWSFSSRGTLLNHIICMCIFHEHGSLPSGSVGVAACPPSHTPQQILQPGRKRRWPHPALKSRPS